MPVIGSKFSLIPGYMDVKCYIQLEEGGNCTVYAFPSVIGPSTEGFHERVQGGVSPNKVGDVVLELIQKVANLIIERMQDRIANA